MTNEELAKKLVKYRELEAQKASLADEQDAIKAEISKHMADTKQEKVVADGITAQFIARTKYNFDVKGILAAVPEAIKSLKITNEAFEKLARGGADIAS
jgi:maltose-binding protein MalE